MFGNLKDPKNGLVSGQDGKLESQQKSLLRFEDRKGQRRNDAKACGKEQRQRRKTRKKRKTRKMVSCQRTEEEGDEDEEEDDEGEVDVKEATMAMQWQV